MKNKMESVLVIIDSAGMDESIFGGIKFSLVSLRITIKRILRNTILLLKKLKELGTN